MFFVVGEVWPSNFYRTGREDAFSGAWNYNLLDRTICTPCYGYHFRGNADYTAKHSQYRLHIEDPVNFGGSLPFSDEHGLLISGRPHESVARRRLAP